VRSHLEKTYEQCVSLASVSVSTTPDGATSSSPEHIHLFSTEPFPGKAPAEQWGRIMTGGRECLGGTGVRTNPDMVRY
jgi:hypothetical protein